MHIFTVTSVPAVFTTAHNTFDDLRRCELWNIICNDADHPGFLTAQPLCNGIGTIASFLHHLQNSLSGLFPHLSLIVDHIGYCGNRNITFFCYVLNGYHFFFPFRFRVSSHHRWYTHRPALQLLLPLLYHTFPMPSRKVFLFLPGNQTAFLSPHVAAHR